MKKQDLPTGKCSVDAVLMASGFSSRFGCEDKLLASFNGIPLVQHTLRLASVILEFNKVFFVTAKEEVARLGAGFPVTALHNKHPERGARESIRLGVRASQADSIMFFTCDQPLLDEFTIVSLLAKRTPHTIVVPVHNGQQGSPSVFGRDFFAELAALQDGENARILKQRHSDKLVLWETPSFLPLQDVDTPEDLKQMEAISNTIPQLEL